MTDKTQTESKGTRDGTKRPRRVLIECTYTCLFGGNTGIQRVVRNICNSSREIAQTMGLQSTPVVYEAGGFYEMDRVPTRPFPTNSTKVYLKNVYYHFRNLIYAVLPFQPVLRFLFPPKGCFGLNSILRAPARLVSFLSRSHKGSQAVERVPIEFGEGDVIVLLDSSWHIDLWHALANAKRNGAKVVVAIYDLIPLTHSWFCVPGHIRNFKTWLEKACRYADAFLAISQTVGKDLKAYLRADPFLHGAAEKPSDFFHLGADLSTPESASAVRKKLQKAFSSPSGPKTYLTIGTIEPRKNHPLLLGAFDKVWQHCADVKLCLVGVKGWSSEEVWYRIRRHPLYNRQLFTFSDLTDTELSYCYEHARALVYPSAIEGFGLPLVEALHHRLPAFASDIPIFREVGGEYCVFFGLGSSDRLAELIIDFEKNGRLPAHKSPETFTWPGWRESCTTFLRKAAELCTES